MIVGILRAIGVVVSSIAAALSSPIDLSESYISTIYPADLSFRSTLEASALQFTSTLRSSNGSL